MKKILTFAVLALSIQFCHAQDVAVYYGCKASNSMVNPCKGACTRICALVENKTNKKVFRAGSDSLEYDKPEVIWYIPAETPEDVFQKMKQNEKRYPNLKVVRCSEEIDEKKVNDRK